MRKSSKKLLVALLSVCLMSVSAVPVFGEEATVAESTTKVVKQQKQENSQKSKETKESGKTNKTAANKSENQKRKE